MMKHAGSNENIASGPTANPQPFRLGDPPRPSSPTRSGFPIANHPDVAGSQKKRTTSDSFSGSDEIPFDSPAGRADGNRRPANIDRDIDEELPVPPHFRARLKARGNQAKAQRPESQAAIQVRRHVFRMLEKNGRRYYDVRGDAVSHLAKPYDLRLIVQCSL